MLEVRSLFKTYEGRLLLTDLTFTVAEGETVCLLGASGSGKSTLLRMIAGLESPDSGSILFDGLDLASTPPHLRDFGLVFQDYSLFPHLDVNANVAFGLKMRRLETDEIDRRVTALLELVNLVNFGTRNIADLSGGEQQRVALARALAIQPRLLMFDEPLGALDRTLREDLLNQLRRILRRTNIPAIYVTHDQEEAFAVADRILILHDGKIIRDGTPSEVSANPKSAFAAEFLGLGNIIEGNTIAKNKFSTAYGVFTVNCGHNHAKREKVRLLVRALAIESGPNVLSGVAADAIFQQDRYRVSLEGGLYYYSKDPPEIGKKITMRVKVECLA